MEYIHAKRKGKGNRPFQNNNAQNQEVVFKWVPVKGIRLSVQENRAVYEEYKQLREQLLKDTVHNPDGTPNEEGISRLRQAGLDDRSIAIIGKGRTPGGYNYHHLFPRAISGSFKDGAVQFGDEKLTSIHVLLPLLRWSTVWYDRGPTISSSALTDFGFCLYISYSLADSGMAI